ncbi:hypothetical protein BGX26_004448 [Mortierella sp. AD094]|nr:hypothetical protein BGX26_004448 [Mortierella sp. AD094]
MQRYRHIIRTITIAEMRSLPPTIPACPNLQSLLISMGFIQVRTRRKEIRDGLHYAIKSDLEGILSNNPSIVRLIIENASVDWSVISKHKNITELDLMNCITDPRSVASHFMDVCTQLESLVMSYIDLPCLLETVIENDDFFMNMKMITIQCIIDIPGYVLLELVRRCPNLETLQFKVFLRNKLNASTTDDFVQLVIDNSWPKLQSLSYDGPKMSDVDTANVLRALKSCCRWDVPAATFSPYSLKVLKEHFPTLTDLNVENQKGIPSDLMQEILCSCPRLKIFRGVEIHAKDIAKGYPWICLSLRYLSIFIKTEPESAIVTSTMNAKSDKLQREVFEQLSRIGGLTSLKIGNKITDPNRLQHGLSLRLDKGLELLGQLTELEHLDFSGTIQAMETHDIKWMLSHWKHLKILSGTCCHYDDRKNINLRNILKPYDIRTDIS